MAQLRNRQIQIPGNLRFYQPETKFTIKTGSFQSIVDQVIMNRMANPAITRAHNLSTDPTQVANEVDAFNAAICERMGWLNYIQAPAAEAPAPKFKALHPIDQKQLSAVGGKVKKVWQGVRSLNDWLDSKISAVAPELSQKRAEVCAACPVNGKGGLEEWFTKPASEAIKKQFEKAADRKLSTTIDDKLNVCTACLCPIKLLVHAPLEFKLAHMGPETRAALHPSCWILSEEKSMSTVVDTKPA